MNRIVGRVQLLSQVSVIMNNIDEGLQAIPFQHVIVTRFRENPILSIMC